jgi:hypothetical protein
VRDAQNVKTHPMVSASVVATAVLAAFAVAITNPFPALDHALRGFSEASLAFIAKSFTPVRSAPEAISAKAAADLDEDLDWRIASQDKTIATWLAFLDKHPHGPHASAAQAALDKLTDAQPPKAPPSAPDLFAALERPPPPDARVVVKWREPRTRYVTRWRYERPRYYRRAPPPFFLGWFGPRDPHQWRER